MTFEPSPLVVRNAPIADLETTRLSITWSHVFPVQRLGS
jgi:hypothetical protein